jgi:hypothetical protein
MKRDGGALASSRRKKGGRARDLTPHFWNGIASGFVIDDFPILSPVGISLQKQAALRYQIWY